METRKREKFGVVFELSPGRISRRSGSRSQNIEPNGKGVGISSVTNETRASSSAMSLDAADELSRTDTILDPTCAPNLHPVIPSPPSSAPCTPSPAGPWPLPSLDHHPRATRFSDTRASCELDILRASSQPPLRERKRRARRGVSKRDRGRRWT